MDGLRIALLTDGLFPYVVGGIQRHSRLLAEHLALEGVEVTVFHTGRGTSAIDAARALVGLPNHIWRSIRVELVDYPPPGRYPGHYVRDSWRYSAALLTRYRDAAIQSDFIYAQGFTGLAFVEARRGDSSLPPVGVNLHGYEMFQPTCGLKSLLAKLMLQHPARRLTQNADYVFSFSRRIRGIIEQRLRVPRDRIIELPNGFDETWLVAGPQPARSPLRFLFLGRNERRKGVPELLCAINSLPPAVGEFHFVGPFSRQSDTPPHVHFHGLITDVDQLRQRIDACDVLLCPSYAEGMPTVILEAMARGLAIIATDVGATGDLVGPDNGLLLPAPDVNLLRDAIRSLAAGSPDQLGAMKDASLRKVVRYTWSNVARSTIEAIRLAARMAGTNT